MRSRMFVYILRLYSICQKVCILFQILIEFYLNLNE